jgi:hypothetical protein
LTPDFTLVSCLTYYDPEDGGDMFLRNVGRLSTDYTALYPRRQKSSYPQQWNLKSYIINFETFYDVYEFELADV